MAVTPTRNDRKTKKRVAWGITGSGDRLTETVEVVKQIKRKYQSEVEITVYLSKAGSQVVKYYKLANVLKESFGRVWIEINANSPFLAGQLQTGKFEFFLIAPATSNTVAKISLSIADTLITNAAIMSLKGFVPVYIMPSDYKEGLTVTKLPDGRDFRLRIRREDAENVKTLAKIDGVSILKKPDDIDHVFKKHFNPP